MIVDEDVFDEEWWGNVVDGDLVGICDDEVVVGGELELVVVIFE